MYFTFRQQATPTIYIFVMNHPSLIFAEKQGWARLLKKDIKQEGAVQDLGLTEWDNFHLDTVTYLMIKIEFFNIGLISLEQWLNDWLSYNDKISLSL